MTELTNDKLQNRIFSLIKWSCFLLLFGRGVLHFTTDQPYELIHTNLDSLTYFYGLVFIFSSFLVFIIKKNKNVFIIAFLYTLNSILLIIHSYASYLKAGNVPEQFVEHSLQMAIPLLFLHFNYRNTINIKATSIIFSILIALTFIGHGAFALAIHYLPENFVVMTEKSLNITSADSVSFLYVIGILDFALSILLFIPIIRNYIIWYFIVWGMLTSFARIYFVIHDEFSNDWLLVNLPNVIYRVPHGLIPIAMLYIFSNENKIQKKIKIQSNFVDTSKTILN